MKILFFGAGVLGSLYAARLCEAGHAVSLLARGQRLQEIRNRGIILEHTFSGKRNIVRVNVTEKLNPEVRYDWIVVLVRKNQVDEVLPIIGANTKTPNILLMVNNPSGYEEWAKVIGRERLLVGFAGAGGAMINGVVKYALAPRLLQPTTLGELDGQNTKRLEEMVRAFRLSGFPTVTSGNMDAWQKTHVAWVSPLSNAIYLSMREEMELSKSGHILRMTVQAIHEAYAVLNHLSVPITPATLKLWQVAPEWLLAEALRFWTGSVHFKTLIFQHSIAARDEMSQVTMEFTELARATGIPTPAYDTLSQSGFLH